MPAILPRERWLEPQLSLSSSLASESIRILREYFRRGAKDSDSHFGYCYTSRHQCMYRVAHSVPKHRLGATSVVTFITKRAGLLCSQRGRFAFCGRRLWVGGNPDLLGEKPRAAIVRQ